MLLKINFWIQQYLLNTSLLNTVLYLPSCFCCFCCYSCWWCNRRSINSYVSGGIYTYFSKCCSNFIWSDHCLLRCTIIQKKWGYNSFVYYIDHLQWYICYRFVSSLKSVIFLLEYFFTINSTVTVLYRWNNISKNIFIKIFVIFSINYYFFSAFCHPQDFTLRSRHVGTSIWIVIHFCYYWGLGAMGLSLTMLNVDKVILFGQPFSYVRSLSTKKAIGICSLIWLLTFALV